MKNIQHHSKITRETREAGQTKLQTRLNQSIELLRSVRQRPDATQTEAIRREKRQRTKKNGGSHEFFRPIISSFPREVVHLIPLSLFHCT
jgi:hypothetical protein